MNASLTLVAAGVFVISASITPVQASSDIEIADGNSLLRLCETALKPNMSRADLLERMYLMGYVRGFTEAQPRAAAYEIPPNVTLEQAVRIIKKWLDDHPRMLDKPAPDLILLSLKDAYPVKER